MGAGSKPTWPSISPKDLKRDSDDQRDSGAYNTEINAYLQQILTYLNDRDNEAIRTHIETILSALSKDDIGIIQLLYGGSISKHTYVDGLSDVDLLAVIDKTELIGKTPDEVLDYFEDLIRQRLRDSDIRKGKMAVTIHFSDGCEIQILPALKTATGIRVADQDNQQWSGVVKPEKFAAKLTEVNQNNNNGVVPIIKIFKAMNSEQPKENQLKGYHIESIAIEAFSNYDGPKTRKAMLMHYTKFASSAVLSPIKDRTGQSVHVDDYLGDENSIQRQRVNRSLVRLSNQMNTADNERSMDRWQDIIN
jgi:hypothetical protein